MLNYTDYQWDYGKGEGKELLLLLRNLARSGPEVMVRLISLGLSALSP